MFHYAESTNQIDFIEFLKKVRSSFIGAHDETIMMVLDGAKAHFTDAAREAMSELHFYYLKMPPYTPEFNR